MQPFLLPEPAVCKTDRGTFRLQGVVDISAPGLDTLAATFLHDLELLTATPLTLRLHPSASAHVVLECAASEETLPAFGDDESYVLDITTNGIRLSAPRRTGIYYGLQTLLQLAQPNGDGTVFPCCVIRDTPRFKWRGLMLDVSRHFMPMDLVKRMVDGMSRVKFNVLHLGLSNNQGFRVESNRFPRLHKVASNGKFYTQNEIRELIAFAAKRGVRLVPEFNMPGHSTCFTLAYQELATGTPPTELRKTSGVFDDEMNPASPHVARFVQDFIAEMAALFPDPCWHFGGDEVTGKAWDADPSVAAFKDAHGFSDNKMLQAHFTALVLDTLKANGKRGIGWEEVAAGKPATDTLIQPWIHPADHAMFEGYQLIASTSYYLDHFLRAEDYYRIDPEAEGSSGAVIGAEACIWSEVMNADNVEAIVWPGALALAERFWSPRAVCDERANEQRLWQKITLAQSRMTTLGSGDLDAPQRLRARLCGGTVLASVALLAEYAAPLVYYFVMDRAKNPHDVTRPFTRLIETLVPDNLASRRFEALVDAALGGEAGPLASELTRLSNLGDVFRRDVAELPALQENQPVADLLAALARAGLEALDGREATHDLPLDALMPPSSNTLEAILDAVRRRRRADLPLLLQEMNIPVLPALRRVLEKPGHGAPPS